MVRISGSSPSSPMSSSSAGKGKGKASTSKRGGTDSVHVSDAAGLRERAKVLLADMPDVRLDKIEEIRDSLEQGTYQMDSKAVSTFIVRNALSEHSWG
ncbi:MAG: flagellar biosynthesis anti-sigma factor FlgM [Ghiorsea sp.]